MAIPTYTPEKRRELALRLGIESQYLYQIARGLKTASPALAKQFNQADPQAQLWDLRPDDWHLIWPELIGVEGAPELRCEGERRQAVANPIQADGALPQSTQLGAQGGGEAAAVHGLQSVLAEPLNTTQQSCGGL